jgi:replicative DNA helicase
MQLVENYPVVRAGEQLFFIGFSDTIQARRPPLTVEVVAQALETIRDWNGAKNSFVLDLVVLDYLQRIPYDSRAESKTVGISRNVDAIKDLTLQFACGVILGSQAKQKVEEREDKVPEGNDSEYTDNLFQSSDKIVSVMRPVLYYEPGVPIAGMTIGKDILENALVVRVCKQKMGRSEFVRVFLFDTARCRYLGDVEAREV